MFSIKSVRTVVALGSIGLLAACSSGARSALPQTQSTLPEGRFIAENATHRSLNDFLLAQGSCITPAEQGSLPPDAQIVNGCVLYTPPAPNFEGWGVAAPAPYCPDGYTVAAVDYAGVVNRWLVQNGHASLGTTISGSVNEKRNADGSGVVNVVINTHNALTWGGCDNTKTLDFVQALLLFGSKPGAVLDGATAAIGSSNFRIVYSEVHYGDPLPDLMYVVLPSQHEYQLQSLQFHSTADGPLAAAFGVPGGTSGHMVVGQNGTFNTVGKGAIDGFTAEFIHIAQQ